MSFSPDGQRVVTGSWDQTARIWPLDVLDAALKRKPRELTPDEVDLYELGLPAERKAYRQTWEVQRLCRQIEIGGRMLSADPENKRLREDLESTLKKLVELLSETPTESDINKALEAIGGAVEDYGLPVSDVQDVLSDIKALRKQSGSFEPRYENGPVRP